MALYAVVQDGTLVGMREIGDWDNYPQHKKDAIDVRGDGGKTLRPIVDEGSGPSITTLIEIERVRRVRSTPPPLPPNADDVRKEAQRRIISLTGASDLMGCLIKQHNANMRATELNDKRISGGTLDAQELAEADALRSLASAIKAIRAASNLMEDNPPPDYADDGRWP